ncbi:MAG: single-stranded-DNA-specific exonuclease RecJ [Pseudomonadota bacterium]
MSVEPRAPRRIERRVPTGPAPLMPDLHPVLDRIYRSRGLTSASELDLSLGQLLPFQALSGIESAVALLEHAVCADRSILFIGDFDADGATSCAVGVRALRAMGASRVQFLVPNRFEFGYGLTPELVDAAARYEPELLITVDNGISSHDGVCAANARGIDVLITDHHLPGPTLPPAAAIVNPNVEGDAFASKSIAGVGVIFYTMIALRARLRARGWFTPSTVPEPNLGTLLDLVALGTVADVVNLDHNNRVLVAQGLERIRRGRANPGISALLQVGGRDQHRVGATDLAFAAAPRLNAAGRLDDMTVGIECLLTDDHGQAEQLAEVLNDLNRERREIESTMRAQAEAALGALDVVESQSTVCLFDDSWHSGVVGILAGRIKDRFNRPTIVFAPDPVGGLKGSGRSVKGVHIRDALEGVATKHPGLIAKFGGHAMAAGLAIERSNFDAFRVAFEGEVAARHPPGQATPVILSDGELSGPEFSVDFAERLASAGPWGQEFAEPVFDNHFAVREARRVGGRHLKLRLASHDASELEAIAFNVLAPSGTAEEADIDVGPHIHAAYRLEVDEYRGRKRLQLVIEHFQTTDPSASSATI